ncbi:MAG TPA: trypsin-like peptidase domain-containing protein [Candidatus Ozemobacteraceae bacterium]|nr:trypsin-like peptidase domain-containing protein [Candidatus Ozemobacteraceae bacterium]
MSSKGDSIIVDSLRAGATCPSCQVPLNEAEEGVICSRCGSLNHLACWNEKGCGGYHCRADGHRSAVGDGPAEIVITKDDIANVRPIPAGCRHGSAAIADELAHKDATWSIISIIAFLLGIGALTIAIWAFSGSMGPMGSGTGTMTFLATLTGSLLAIVVGALSLAFIQQNRNIKGNIFAFGGMGAGVAALCLSLIPLWGGPERAAGGVKFDMGKVADTIKTAEPRIRGALMANVHIRSGSSYNEGTGSGIAIRNRDSFTYVLTNAHVLTLGEEVSGISELERKAKDVDVTFYSGETRRATPVWLAPDGIDLAILRVQTPPGFQPMIKYQPNRPISTGQRVFAIGNPMGLNWTYTEGVVSALRTNRYGSRDLTVIQMQTPLNHGNSGGGLYDPEGFLVGVNTWIYAKTVSEGLNFSLAIDEFFKVLDPEWAKILTITGSPAAEEGGSK